MNYGEERERIISLALRARIEAEVACAIQELDRWVLEHPDDEEIRDAHEPLTLRQLAFDDANNSSVAEMRV